MIDNISGIEDNTGQPKYLRYASKIRFVLSMVSDTKVYVPTVEITYEERVIENKVL